MWAAGLGLGEEKTPGAPGLGSGCPEEVSGGQAGFSHFGARAGGLYLLPAQYSGALCLHVHWI